MGIGRSQPKKMVHGGDLQTRFPSNSIEPNIQHNRLQNITGVNIDGSGERLDETNRGTFTPQFTGRRASQIDRKIFIGWH